MMTIDNHEVENRHEEFGILNTTTGAITWCDSQSEAEYDALLYKTAAIVRRYVYETKPVVILTSS